MEEITINYDEIFKETDLSWGLTWSDIDEPIWFPKSICSINRINKSITMPEWLYDKNLSMYD